MHWEGNVQGNLSLDSFYKDISFSLSFFFLALLGLMCGTQDLCCMWDLAVACGLWSSWAQ